MVPNQTDNHPEEDLTEAEADGRENLPTLVISRPPLDRSTKVILVLFGLCGLGVIGLSGWLIKNRISSPFNINVADLVSVATTTSPSAVTEDLKNKDTDGDGINDYNEVYLYNTSPYLKDTDGDGIPDGTEIKNGTDPNCKEGDKCIGVHLVNADTKLSDLLPQFSPANASLKDETLKQFRQILLDNGMDAQTLAKIDDNYLLIMMDAIVSYDNQQAAPVDVNQLDEAEIRKFLVDSGLKQSEVDRIPPADLKDLIKVLL